MDENLVDDAEGAAIKLQAAFRGHRSRKDLSNSTTVIHTKQRQKALFIKQKIDIHPPQRPFLLVSLKLSITHNDFDWP